VNGAAGTRATHLCRGYVVACIDGHTERSQWAGAHESTRATSEFQWELRWSFSGLPDKTSALDGTLILDRMEDEDARRQSG